MIKTDTNKKPETMSQLYWNYLKGKIEIEDLTQRQFNQIVLEQYTRYKERGGRDTFEQFMDFIKENGL